MLRRIGRLVLGFVVHGFILRRRLNEFDLIFEAVELLLDFVCEQKPEESSVIWVGRILVIDKNFLPLVDAELALFNRRAFIGAVVLVADFLDLDDVVFDVAATIALRCIEEQRYRVRILRLRNEIERWTRFCEARNSCFPACFMALRPLLMLFVDRRDGHTVLDVRM